MGLRVTQIECVCEFVKDLFAEERIAMCDRRLFLYVSLKYVCMCEDSPRINNRLFFYRRNTQRLLLCRSMFKKIMPEYTYTNCDLMSDNKRNIFLFKYVLRYKTIYLII